MPEVLTKIRIQDLVDILVVGILIYYVLVWLKGSRAFQLIKGFLFLACIYMMSIVFALHTLQWLMQQLATIIFISLIVVFQPELRRGLERLGRHFIVGYLFSTKKELDHAVMLAIVRAIDRLARKKTGAIIVCERRTGLNEYIESGEKLDARVSAELLVALFQKTSPLHDGAVIISEERLAAASCLLPLSDTRTVNQKIGTRHRAAIGLSEVSDAVVLIVSEETGAISVAENGVLTVGLTKEALKDRLRLIYRQTTAFRKKE